MINEAIKEKEVQYIEYLKRHSVNIRKAFDIYGAFIARLLYCNLEELNVRINNHDASKYSDAEFNAYRKRFFPVDESEAITDDSDEFKNAWEHHYLANSHHPEHYFKYGSPHEMPNIDIAEMILDWIAMSYEFGDTAYSYYDSSSKSSIMHPNTKFKVEYLLHELRYFDDDNKISKLIT